MLLACSRVFCDVFYFVQRSPEAGTIKVRRQAEDWLSSWRAKSAVERMKKMKSSTYVGTYIVSQTHTHLRTYTLAHIHMRTHARTHTHTHTLAILALNVSYFYGDPSTSPGHRRDEAGYVTASISKHSLVLLATFLYPDLRQLVSTNMVFLRLIHLL